MSEIESSATGSILGFGALGLGLALAVLAIYLLHRVTSGPRTRTGLLRTIKFFWFSAIILMLAGIYTETTSSRSKIAEVEARIVSLVGELESARKRSAELNERLETMQATIDQFGAKEWAWDARDAGEARYQCHLDGEPVGEAFDCTAETLGTAGDLCGHARARQAFCALNFSREGWKASPLAQ